MSSLADADFALNTGKKGANGIQVFRFFSTTERLQKLPEHSEVGDTIP
jgi:hypothetical protein